MSYSGDVKNELAEQMVSARHCRLSELASIFRNCAVVYQENGFIEIGVQTENPLVARKFFTLIEKIYNINTTFEYSEEKQKEHLYPRISDQETVESILKSLHFMAIDGTLVKDWEYISPLLLKRNCCMRAFLRGSFLASGSMSDPAKGYHLEFVMTTEKGAKQVQEIIGNFDIEAKIVARKKYFVVYIKEGEAIVDLLNVMEAHISLMDLENLRIVKGMRNDINRRVNCETANISKAVEAANKQREDILYIRDHGGLRQLPGALLEVAEIRLEYPELSLKELGEKLDPPIGKSGVNHRLRKIGEIAEKIRL